MYKKFIENGYIVAVSETCNDGIEISREEYNSIIEALNNRPQLEEGFSAMLKDDSHEWELVANPEPVDTEATESDYIDALNDLGVNINGD